MNKRSIEILNAIIRNDELNGNYDDHLVIIHQNTWSSRISTVKGPFVSFNNLTSEDFFEIYRYKKSLEENKDRKGEMIK